MPLPKPPEKRAALLSATDFEAQATPRRAKRTQTRAEAPDRAAVPVAAADAPPLPGARALKARAAPATVVVDAPAPAAVAAAAERSRADRPHPVPKARRPRGTGPAKLFVLDTNVLMHDPMSLFRFEEHDIYLPMITLEELDGHKKGMTEVARNARQVSRDLDARWPRT